MKKYLSFLFVILSLVLAFSLSGCGREDSQDAQKIGAAHGEEPGRTDTTNDEKLYYFSDVVWLDDQRSDTTTFWTMAVDTKSEIGSDVGTMFIAMDTDLNAFCVIPAEYTLILSDFTDPVDGIAAVAIRDVHQIINKEGEIVTDQYVELTREVFLTLSVDSTGVTIWTAEDVSTFSSSGTVLRAKGVDGTVKQSWNLAENAATWEAYRYGWFHNSASSLAEAVDDGSFVNLGSGLYCIYKSDSVAYGSFNRYVFDVNNGAVLNIGVPADEIETIDNRTLVVTDPLGQPNNVFTAYDVPSGKVLWRVNSYHSLVYDGCCFPFHNGYGFAYGQTNNYEKYGGFFDQHGNLVVDLLKTIPAIQSRETYVVDACMLKNREYGIISFVNSKGDDYVTLIDMQGRMLFEPVRGHHGFDHYDGNLRMRYSDDQLSPDVYSGLPVIFCDGDIYLLSYDGEKTALPRGMRYANCVNGTYYYVDKGSIVAGQYTPFPDQASHDQTSSNQSSSAEKHLTREEAQAYLNVLYDLEQAGITDVNSYLTDYDGDGKLELTLFWMEAPDVDYDWAFYESNYRCQVWQGSKQLADERFYAMMGSAALCVDALDYSRIVYWWSDDDMNIRWGRNVYLVQDGKWVKRCYEALTEYDLESSKQLPTVYSGPEGSLTEQEFLEIVSELDSCTILQTFSSEVCCKGGFQIS